MYDHLSSLLSCVALRLRLTSPVSLMCPTFLAPLLFCNKINADQQTYHEWGPNWKHQMIWPSYQIDQCWHLQYYKPNACLKYHRGGGGPPPAIFKWLAHTKTFGGSKLWYKVINPHLFLHEQVLRCHLLSCCLFQPCSFARTDVVSLIIIVNHQLDIALKSESIYSEVPFSSLWY